MNEIVVAVLQKLDGQFVTVEAGHHTDRYFKMLGTLHSSVSGSCTIECGDEQGLVQLTFTPEAVREIVLFSEMQPIYPDTKDIAAIITINLPCV